MRKSKVQPLVALVSRRCKVRGSLFLAHRPPFNLPLTIDANVEELGADEDAGIVCHQSEQDFVASYGHLVSE